MGLQDPCVPALPSTQTQQVSNLAPGDFSGSVCASLRFRQDAAHHLPPLISSHPIPLLPDLALHLLLPSGSLPTALQVSTLILLTLILLPTTLQTPEPSVSVRGIWGPAMWTSLLQGSKNRNRCCYIHIKFTRQGPGNVCGGDNGRFGLCSPGLTCSNCNRFSFFYIAWNILIHQNQDVVTKLNQFHLQVHRLLISRLPLFWRCRLYLSTRLVALNPLRPVTIFGGERKESRIRILAQGAILVEASQWLWLWRFIKKRVGDPSWVSI